MKIFIPIIAVLIAFSSCKGIKPLANTTQQSLPNGTFYVSTLGGENVLAKKIHFTINTTKNRISGNAGCNDFSAGLIENEGAFELKTFVATEMYCDEAVMELERGLMSALSSAETFDFENSVLSLYSKEDKKTVLIALLNN